MRKLAVLGLVAVMITPIVFACLSSPVRGVEASYYGYYNTTEEIGRLELFNMTFENEELGAWEAIHHLEGYPQVNLSIEIVDMNNTQRLRVNQTFETTIDWSAEGMFGHRLEVFNMSFQWYSNEVVSVANLYASFRVVKSTDGVLDSVTLVQCASQTGSDKVRIGSTDYSVTRKEWHIAEVAVDTRAGTVALSVDGVYKGSTAITPFDFAYAWRLITSKNSVSGQYMDWYFDNLTVTTSKYAVQPISSPYTNRTNIVLTLDDGRENQTQIADMFDPYGFTATTGLTTSWVGAEPIGGTPFLDWPQVRDLFANHSWELAAHSVTHPDFTLISAEERDYQFRASAEYIIENVTEATISSWIFPYNEATDLIVDEAANYYDAVIGPTNVTRWDLQRFPFGPTSGQYSHVYRITTSLSYSHHGVLDIWTHGVSPDDTSGDANYAVFYHLVNETVNRSMSISSVQDGYNQVRNWVTSQISGGTSSFSLSHLREYEYNHTWLEIASPRSIYGVGVHYLVNGVSYSLFPDGDYARVMVVNAEDTYVNVTSWDEELRSWTCPSATAITSYTLYGLDSSTGYKVYQDGVVITTGTGPSFSFTATGGGEFEVVVWNTAQVTTMVVLTVNMIGLGIMVSVVVGWVLPFTKNIKNGTYRTADKMMKELVRGVMFIIVACAMYGVLWQVAIG